MSADILKESGDQTSNDVKDRKRDRQQRALGANPDVPSPESGDTSEDEETGSSGP